MILNVGVGGGKFATVPLDADVSIDVDVPQFRLSNFVRADALYLPFRDSTFDLAYCHNVLEHVSNPRQAIQELHRVSGGIHIVQDRVWAIGSYATPSHLWFQGFNHKLYKYPRTRIGILLSRWLELLYERYMIMWQKLHFTGWRRWTDYYLVVPHYEVLQ